MPEDNDRWRVFLSSTFRELSTYRLEIRRQVAQELGDRVDLVALDDGTYAQFTPDATQLSVGELRECDLDVLLGGVELGSRARTGESYTEQEIRAAHENGIPIYAFMFDAVATESGAGNPSSPEPGSSHYWDRRREQLVRAGIRPPDKTFWLPAAADIQPAEVAAQVVMVLRDWLRYHARPHRLRATHPDVAFVDREQAYRDLKQRVMQGLTSVVSGFYGTGKSTVVEALCADRDVTREYTLPMTELSMDLSVPTSVAEFPDKAKAALETISASAAGTRHLLVVTMSSVLDRGMLQHDTRQVEDFIRSTFADSGRPAGRPTLVFKVPEAPAAGRLCGYLQLATQAHIPVPDLSRESALQMLLVMNGLHDRCSECDRYGPDVAAAAGCWPPLLADCARSFDEQRGNAAGQHRYLRHAGQAFNDELTGPDQMYRTFRQQMGRLPADAQEILSAAGVLLPRPFAFSTELITAMCGLTASAAGKALETLATRGYIERVEQAGPAADDGEADDGFSLHPFFWVFLQRPDETTPDSPASGERVRRFRSASFRWLDEKMNDTFDEDLTYGGWFELEKPESQSLIANWIYQLAHLDDRRRAAEELARMFLKAHWWWGCYLPFSFCELLNELASKAVDWSPPADDGDDLVAVAEALHTFTDAYPRGGQFDDPPTAAAARAAWSTARRALRSMAACLDIPVDDQVAAVRQWAKSSAQHGDARAKSRRDIAKLLHIFLAHCDRCFFGEKALSDQALKEIERHYESSLAIARQQRDGWNQPWLLCEMSDAQLAAAKARRASASGFKRTDAACTQKARDYAQKALTLARQRGEKDSDDLDFEILSIAERLLGDIDLHVGEHAAAAGHHARAVHYAHCFEVCPDHQPDPYTLAFEREQRWRASAPLLELADAGGDSSVLRMLSGQIAEFFGTDPGAAWELVTKVAAQEGRAPGTAVNRLFAPYDLPPEEDLPRRDDIGRAQIEEFRSEAKEQIWSTERRYPDLVQLPDDS